MPTCKSSHAEEYRVEGPSGILDFLSFLYFFLSVTFEESVKDNDV